MLKNILSLEGAKQLSKNEQKTILGGQAPAGCLKWNPGTQVCSKWDPNF